jgi:hypothetical protein
MEDAKEINRRKRKRAQMIAQGLMMTADEEDMARVIPYTLQRDYTYSTNPCPALSQLVFTFRDDADNTRQKSAFYNTTQSKLMLRKKRVKVLGLDCSLFYFCLYTPRQDAHTMFFFIEQLK